MFSSNHCHLLVAFCSHCLEVGWCRVSAFFTLKHPLCHHCCTLMVKGHYGTDIKYLTATPWSLSAVDQTSSEFQLRKCISVKQRLGNNVVRYHRTKAFLCSRLSFVMISKEQKGAFLIDIEYIYHFIHYLLFSYKDDGCNNVFAFFSCTYKFNLTINKEWNLWMLLDTVTGINTCISNHLLVGAVADRVTCFPSPVNFHRKAPTSHETRHIMRSRCLFLLIYLLGSCFGKIRFCVLSPVFKCQDCSQRQIPDTKDKPDDILHFSYCQLVSWKEAKSPMNWLSRQLLSDIAWLTVIALCHGAPLLYF